MHEYQQLRHEQERINDRIKEMENHGLHGRSNSVSSSTRPNVCYDMFKLVK